MTRIDVPVALSWSYAFNASNTVTPAPITVAASLALSRSTFSPPIGNVSSFAAMLQAFPPIMDGACDLNTVYQADWGQWDGPDGTFVAPTAMRVPQVLEGTVSALVLALTALGLSLVFGVMRIVNVAHGEFFMLGAVLTWYVSTTTGSFLLALAAAPVVVAAVAVLADRLVLARIGYRPESTIVATIGLLYILQQLVLTLYGPYARPVPAPVYFRVDFPWFGYSGYKLVVAAIAQDPNRPDYVYVGSKQALFMSHDGGANWKVRGGNLPFGDFTSILINPRNGDEVFAGNAYQISENGGGVYRSTNAGLSWARIDPKDGRLPSQRIWALAFDANDQNVLFVGSHSAGVYVVPRNGDSLSAAQQR